MKKYLLFLLGVFLFFYSCDLYSPGEIDEIIQNNEQNNPLDSDSSYIHVTSLSISESEIYVLINSDYTLDITFSPEDVSDTTATWSSSKSEVATVSSEGVVSGLSLGNVTITAATNDPMSSATATCSVIVNDGTVTGVSLDSSTLTIGIGSNRTEQLTATISPPNAINQNVSWSSSNGDIATVSEDGLVTGVDYGTATITATTGDGDFIASCEVTVTDIVDVTGVTVTDSLGSSSAATVLNGTIQLYAEIIPSDATNQNITWSSSNTTIATVSESGLVTGIAEGTATITVTTDDSGFEDTITIEVVDEDGSVTGASLSDSSVTIACEETYQLTATITPSYATNKNVTWSSSNTDTATVNSSGLITGVAAGSTTITVTTEDNDYTATCSVTVDESPFMRWKAAGEHSWTSIAISEDGDFIAATTKTGSDSYINDDNEWVDVSYGGIYTSSDHGESWSLQSHTEDLDLTNLSMSADGGLMAAYVENDYIYTSTDKGATWTKRTSAGARDWTDIDVSSDGTFIAACPSGGYVFTSGDGGATWTAQTGSGAKAWSCLSLSEDGSVIITGIDGDYLYKSTDKGTSWNEAGADTENTYACAISDDGLIIYIYTNTAASGYSYLSTDGGTNWESFAAAGYPAASYDGNVAFIFSSSSEYCTWDAGTTWQELDRSFGSPGALSGNGQLAVYASSGNNADLDIYEDSYLFFWNCSESIGNLSGSVSDLSDIDLVIIGSTSVSYGVSATFRARADDSFTVVGWYLDNDLLDGETGTTYSTATDLSTGGHTLTVQVKANELLYSDSFRFQVTE